MRAMQRMACVAALVLAAGCGNEGGAEGDAESRAAAGSSAATDTASTGIEPEFERAALRGDRCLLLTAEDVAEAAGVAVADVEENPGLRCLYAWDGGSAVVHSTVHRNVRSARRHHADATTDTTAAEVREQKQRLQQELAEKAGSDGDARRDAAVGGALLAAMPEQDSVHERLEGLGNEAAVDNRNHVYVRYGNVTLTVAAKIGEDADRALGIALARRAATHLAELAD